MKPEDLLLAAELSTEKIAEFLKRYGFKDPESADRNLQLMAEEVPLRYILARMMKGLLEAARQSPDPDAAINHFERLFTNVPHRANFLGFLGEAPEALEALINGNGSIELFRSQLGAFDFDSDPLVTLRVDHLVDLLFRFVEGEIPGSYVEGWADLLEVRDDVSFDPAYEAEIKQVVHDLANPILSGPLDKEGANEILQTLRNARQ